jgi:hypothetical protein
VMAVREIDPGIMVSVLASSVVDRGFIGGIMVSVIASSVVDRGFIGGIMVSVLASNVVDRGFIGGIMVSVIASSVVDRGFIGGIAYEVICRIASRKKKVTITGKKENFLLSLILFLHIYFIWLIYILYVKSQT